MEEAGECERIELETRKGKEDSVRSEEERECVRSREKIAKEIDRKRRRDGERERSCTKFEEEWNCRTQKRGRGNRRGKRERENQRESRRKRM